MEKNSTKDPSLSQEQTIEENDEQYSSLYQNLLSNNIEELFRHAFPVIDSILEEEEQQKIIENYLQYYAAQPPSFNEIPRLFVNFLQQQSTLPYDFLPELAHYEWLELDLALSPLDVSELNFNPEGDIMKDIPLLSPLLRANIYEWPVHLIGQNYIPQQPCDDPTYLAIYRDHTGEINFLEINSLTFLLLEQLEENCHSSGQQLLINIAHQIRHPNPQAVLEAGQTLLTQLKSLDIILGTKIS